LVTTLPESLLAVSARGNSSSDSGKVTPREIRKMGRLRIEIRDFAQIFNNQ
jgi:hypothetical protein